MNEFILKDQLTTKNEFMNRSSKKVRHKIRNYVVIWEIRMNHNFDDVVKGKVSVDVSEERHYAPKCAPKSYIYKLTR